jgi:hypothetical protein
MGFGNWLSQTVGKGKDFLKQTANTVSNGLNWAHQNIIQPGVAVGKAIGGDVGKFAESVEAGAGAVNDLNQKYRSGTIKAGDLVNTGKSVKEAYERGRESAGGAKRQVLNEASNIKTIAREKNLSKAGNYVKQATALGKKVGGAIKRPTGIV